jgi:putative FmdB family regulatory protein
MPTYEYACEACGEHTEVQARLADPPLERCPACGGTVRKVFHPAGIVFKGSGFYATDSRSGKKKATGGASGGSTAAPAPSSPSSSEGSSGSATPSSGGTAAKEGA